MKSAAFLLMLISNDRLAGRSVGNMFQLAVEDMLEPVRHCF